MATMHGADVKICGDCASEPECRIAAVKMMGELQEKVALGNAVSMRSSVIPTTVETSVSVIRKPDGLSKMAQTMFEKMVSANVDLSILASHRINPFPPTFKQAHLSGVANLLLSERWVTESDVIALFIEAYAMSEKKAVDQLRLIRQILIFANIVDQSDDGLRLKENNEFDSISKNTL
ncbi:MAG: hypothetical protein IBX56_20245 [Methylomicrobium sp.]|nr:hypothetical protein [Methylomicrobium sp.]